MKPTVRVTRTDVDVHGNTESVWEDEEGYACEADEHDDVSIAESAVRFILDEGGSVDPSSYPQWCKGVWYTETTGVQDTRTGTVSYLSFHLDGFTETDERAVYAAISKRNSYRTVR